MFVARFFNDEGFFRQTIWDSVNDRTKFFETPAASLPRYYWTHATSGVINLHMTFESGQEKELVNNSHYILSEKARITYWFANGTQVSAVLTIQSRIGFLANKIAVDLVWQTICAVQCQRQD